MPGTDVPTTTIPVPVTGVSRSYYVSQPKPGRLPYLYFDPPSNTSIGDSIVIALPSDLSGTVAVDVAPFHYNPDKRTLTLDGSTIWDFSNTSAPVRGTLRGNYDAFVLALETTGNVPASWIRKIQAMIASCIPSTFPESLYFRYRLDAANRYVDVLPGMRLRVDSADYQFIYPATGSGTSTDTALNGMVSSGSSYLYAQSALVAGTESVVFDAYFGALTTPSAPSGPGGAANVLDFIGPTTLKPYYRLFYPLTLASAAGPGSSGTQANPTIVGTTTLQAMADATTAYLANGTVTPSATTWVGYFRGRAAVVPEIALFLQGNPSYVSVGTTIRQAYEAYTPLGRASGQSLATNSIQRSPSAFLYTQASYPPYQVLNTGPAETGGKSAPYADGTDGFDVPAWTGDAYAFLVANV